MAATKTNTTAEQQLLAEENELNRSLFNLTGFGGYELIESTVEGANVLNPEKKALRKIFLTDESRKPDREKLKKSLQLMVELLEGSEDIPSILTEINSKLEQTEAVLQKNTAKALDACRELEQNYRSLALFFKNTARDKVRNITIYNLDIDRLKDLDNTLAFDRISAELKNCHDRLDLRQNYSLMVIPGYLGSNTVVEKWAQVACENKVLLITDFQHIDDPDLVIEEFDKASLTGQEVYRSNVIMTCNWLVGRNRHADLGEEEELYVPPSTALAGKIYSTLISQPTAGKLYGGIHDAIGVKFGLKKSEISELERRGLVPMVYEWDKVMAFSAKTLYNGPDIGLQTYSVVRVFEYIGKVLIDFLNRQAFTKWTPKVQKDLGMEISRYLKSIKGHDKVIQDYKLMKLEQDPETKRIYIDLHISPFFPAKNFLLKLGGTRGDTAEEWAAAFSEGA